MPPPGFRGPPLRRRAILGTLLAAGLPARLRPAAATTSAIAVGAIRWDAWQAPDSAPTRAVERALSPPQYRYRLPFFARVGPDGTVSIDGSAQAVMDQEIALALRAGISFWAFLGYPRDSSMAAGLHRYLSSTQRRGLRFCVVSELVQWGFARDTSTPVLDWHLDLMRHPEYQRTADGRPLYFLGFLSENLIAERWGDIAALRQAVQRFRTRAVETGAGDPYLVIMARPEPGVPLARALGAEALSAYAIAEAEPAAPYAALAQLAERRWEEYARSGLGVVPTVMTGWDRRPRVESPMPWERWQRPGAGMDRYYVAPQPAELVAHLQRGIAWIQAHPQVATAGAALVYAWNENDEGGWLVPTLPFDDRRIEALRGLLCAPQSPAAGPGCD